MESVARTEYQLDLSHPCKRINPLLFGHNLEHTRSCVWQGLSAQLLHNRKFYGKPQRDGVALDWYAIASPRAYFELSYHAYTEHADRVERRVNETHSQRIAVYAVGEKAGIGQRGIPLHAGWRYEGRAVLYAPAPIDVRICVTAVDGNSLHDTVIPVTAVGEWQEFAFTFTPECTCWDARLELTIAGVGEVFIGAVSLLPAGHFHGMRADVVALLREIGCTLLRWPGGNFAGDYRWQDGLLPVDKRAPLASFQEMETLPHTRGFDCHEIGIDEFIVLCREIGAEPFLTINIAWDTPEAVAAWVEYCNGSVTTVMGRQRAERGHPEPYRVKYWSLGNELGWGHMEGPNTPEAYVAKAAACATAMQQVDPNIVFCSSGIWGSDAWLKELHLLAPFIAHFAHHHYTGKMTQYAGAPALDEFRRVAGEPTHVIEGMRELRSRVDAHAAEKTLGISLDEWNVWYAWYRHPGVAEGIHHAAMLNQLCREAESLGVTLACFFQPINEGVILVEPFHAYLPAGGQIFPLLKEHRGNRLLELLAVGEHGDVDATASLNDDGMLIITLVNRDPCAEQQVDIRLTGAGATTVEGVLLAAEDFLPGTDFSRLPLEVTVADAALSLRLPKHSVALVKCGTR